MNKKISLSSFGKGYFRIVEILAILIVITCAIGLGYLVSNKLREEGNKVGELQKKTVDLRDEIRKMKKNIEEQKSPSNNTQAIVENLEAFQTRFLKNQQEGRLYVINQINKLVKNNGVSLTGGISFQKVDTDKIEIEKTNSKTRNVKGRKTDTGNKSLYPALEANFSVSGNYVSFRKFLYSLETDKMFFVIDSLNLQTPDTEAKTPTGSSQRVASVQRTVLQNPGEITVQIGIKAYFRKEENATN